MIAPTLTNDPYNCLRNLVAGAPTTFNDLTLTIRTVVIAHISKVRTKGQMVKPILYAKVFSQKCTRRIVIGKDRTLEITTNPRKERLIFIKISPVDAPNTFLTAISFDRRIRIREVSENSPMPAKLNAQIKKREMIFLRIS